MSGNSSWQLVRIRLAVLLCMLFISQAANSQGDSKNTPPADNNPCGIAKAFQLAGMYDQAIEKYEAILKDVKFSPEVLTCAREGLVDATRTKLDKNCKQAEQALDVGSLSEAEALYKKLATPTASKEDISCAKKGLQNVAIQYAARGEAREKLNDFMAAETWYKAAKVASSDYLEADDKLIKVSRKIKKTYLTLLTDQGYENEAEVKLKEFLKDPTFAQDAKDFAFINRPHVPLWKELRATPLQSLHLPNWPPFTWLPTVREMHWLPATLQEMPIIEVLILILLIGLMGRKFWWGPPTLDIKDFSTASATETATDAEPDKNKSETDAAFVTELEHRLIDFSGASRTNRQVLMVSAPIKPVTVDLTTNIPVLKGWDVLTKGLQKLISYLIARRSLVANVSLQEQGSDLVINKVTIQLECGNRIIAKHTLRASDFKFDAKDTEDDLTDCAAIWVLFQLQRNPVQWSAIAVTFLRKLVCQPRKILGTADWEAYAWFYLGDKRYQGADQEKAKSAYLKALSLDPSFLACRVNLAGVYHGLADENGYNNNKQQMEEALRQLRPVLLCHCGWQRWIGVADPSPYTGLFRAAAINFDLAGLSEKEEEKKKYTDEARKVTGDLVKWIRRTQCCRYFNRELMRYLDWRRPIAECMELGLTVASLPPSGVIHTDVKNNLKRVAKILEERVDFYSLYNLACTYALFAIREKEATKSEIYRLSMMNFLERGLKFTSDIESLGTGLAVTCAKGAQRATSDAAFKRFRDDPEFLRIVTQCPAVVSANVSQQPSTTEELIQESQTS